MRTVQVSNGDNQTGTVSFRGIAAAKSEHDGAGAAKRLFRCTPTHFVPKEVARRIANRLSSGEKSGAEEGFQWRARRAR